MPTTTGRTQYSWSPAELDFLLEHALAPRKVLVTEFGIGSDVLTDTAVAGRRYMLLNKSGHRRVIFSSRRKCAIGGADPQPGRPAATTELAVGLSIVG
jgi:hypothetical protein